MTRPLIRRRDVGVAAAFSAAVTSPLVAAACGAPFGATAALAWVSTGLVTLAGVSAVRRLERGLAQTRSSTQASCELAASLGPYAPLPPMDGWTAHPEFAAACARVVLTSRPRRVVELGSGVSTAVLAMALERNGEGHILSLDHDAAYAERTRASLRARGIASRVRVVHAPLVPVPGTQARTYDLGGVDDTPIDVLVVDGPPNGEGLGARTAALLALVDRLAPEATVLVDDAARADERRMVAALIERSLGAFEATFVDSTKGVAILTRAVPSS